MNPRQGVLKPLWFHPLRHLWKLATDHGYRTSAWLHARYGRHPRNTPLHCRVDGLDLSVPDAASFLSSWDEIFARQLYRCELPETPRILDLGANIGLASLYFLRLFPKASITAVEADPEIFAILQRNLTSNDATAVRLIEGAAWTEDGSIDFQPDGADGGHIGGGGRTVHALDTWRLLTEESYDLIKMDIEGAERIVLPTLADALGNTRLIFVEYHSDRDSEQALDKVIGTLAAAGFRLHVESLVQRAHPWLPSNGQGLELQLNIFGWRP